MAVQNDSGFRSFLTSEAITAWVRVTMDSNGKVGIAGAGDVGIGVAQHDAASGANLNVKLWSAPGTFKMKAITALTLGDQVCPVAAGKVDDDGTGVALGRAFETVATANSIIEVIPEPGLGAFEKNSDEGKLGPVYTVVQKVCACGATTLLTLTRKMRVLDVFIVAAEANKAGTMTLVNGAPCAIATAITQNCTDETLTRAALIDDAKAVLDAGCVLQASLSVAQETWVTVTLIPVA